MSDVVLEGRTLAGKYELVRLLGQGGMGAVYEARNHLGKRYAVKMLLKAEFAQDPGLTTRFFREAKASAAIESEHIVEVYDTGVDPETNFPFIIMELLKGEDLEHTIARVGALNVVGASRVITQAALGLGKAHESGIVHRDIKPANIYMTQRDSGDSLVKILDFGIAKQQLDQLASAEGAGLTKTGSMLGTPLYMSPEQAQGLKTIDARTDLWSLGMCLYEALSGRTPWGDVDTLGALILSICSRDVPPLQDIAPWVPPDLARVVHWTITRDVNQRCPSAAALVEQLRPFTSGSYQITPDVLLGVEEAERRTTAPRAEIAQSASMVLTSSQASAAKGEDKQKPASSKAPLFAALGLAGLALVGGGAMLAMKKSDAPNGKANNGAQSSETANKASETSNAKSEPAANTAAAPTVEETTVALPIKCAPGSTVKVNGKEEKLVDGRISLKGMPGTQFFVSVYETGKPPLVQSVFIIGDGKAEPDKVDTALGVVAVKPPPKIVAAPTGGGKVAPPTTDNPGPAPKTADPPTTPKAADPAPTGKKNVKIEKDDSEFK
jgi:serine/threonine protein kinase